MAYRKLDNNGKPINPRKRTSRTPATRIEGKETLYHYEIFVRITDVEGKTRDKRKRLWLADDLAAQLAEQELKAGRVLKTLTWLDAHRRWLEANKDNFSAGHASNSVTTIKMWCERFGNDSTVEGTSLAQFSSWAEEICRKGKGRGGQIRRAHMLAIARWCRDRGLVDTISFEHSPKPEARLNKRRAAEVKEFLAIAEAMPTEMLYVWRMMGLTGMRLSAACGVREDGIGAASFKVLTKFRKEVEYPITPMIADLIADARRYKADRGIVSEFLFTREGGKPWNRDRFHSRLKALIKARGLPTITSHQLRHMAGTLLAKNNYSRDIIQAGLAHDDSESATTYIDQTMEMRRTALTALESALNDVYFLSNSDTNSVPTPATIRQQEPPATEVLDEIFSQFIRHISRNINN